MQNTKPIAKSLGLSTNEQNSFSLLKCLTTPNFELDGIEAEAHRSLVQRLPAPQRDQVRGTLVPAMDLRWPTRSNRGIQSVGGGGGTAGGNLVATHLDGGNFISVLENRCQVMALGATVLGGQVGNLSVPKQLESLNTHWLDENSVIPDSVMSFGQIQFTPKTIAAYTSFSRLLAQQSTPEIEGLVRQDLLRVVSIEVDRAAIAGGGGLEPVGLLNQSGITDLGSTGADGDPLSWDILTELECTVAEKNADSGALAYLTNSRVRKAGKNTTQNSSNLSSWLWQPDPSNRPSMGMFNGYSVAISENVPNDGVKGSSTDLNSIIFGNWADLLITTWGALEIVVNPFGAGFKQGSTEARVMMSLDINVRRPESFAFTREIIGG